MNRKKAGESRNPSPAPFTRPQTLTCTYPVSGETGYVHVQVGGEGEGGGESGGRGGAKGER